MPDTLNTLLAERDALLKIVKRMIELAKEGNCTAIIASFEGVKKYERSHEKDHG